MMTLNEFLEEWHSPSPQVLVHTSGSTGSPKPMLVDKYRMEASARTTCRFLGLRSGQTALLCLPLDYIAGKMQVVRALTCQLRLIAVEPSGHPLAQVDEAVVDFAAMVPLQVWNALQAPNERRRLMQIRHLIIGGGPIDDALARELAPFPNAVWSTYGMTETLSHIALRRLSGPEATTWYTPLEGVSVALNADNCLVVNAPAVHEGALVTNDVAELSPQGCFRILGRKDNVVCSGGLKIQIEEVEQLLRRHTSLPLLLTRKPDAKLGEALALMTETTDLECLRGLCRRVLPRYWQPRSFLSVEHLPVTANGKPARAEAARLAQQLSADTTEKRDS